MSLFNGTDLTGWTTFGGTSQWTAETGILKNAKSGANLVTTAKFRRLQAARRGELPEGQQQRHLPARPLRSAGGGRDRPRAAVGGPGRHLRLPRAQRERERGAGAWQTFDITLVGRRVTVVLNGKTIIGDQTIPGITGGALDSDEGAPGPIYLQGDHGAVQYRNLRITPAAPAK